MTSVFLPLTRTTTISLYQKLKLYSFQYMMIDKVGETLSSRRLLKNSPTVVTAPLFRG